MDRFEKYKGVEVNIYVLTDPRNHEVRYVGRTMMPLAVRLNQHLSDKGSVRKRQWIAELKELGLKPIIELIDRVEYVYQSGAELMWIRRYEKAGANLTNGRFTPAVRHETTKQLRERLVIEFAELLSQYEEIPRNPDGSPYGATMANRALQIAIQAINEGFLNSKK